MRLRALGLMFTIAAFAAPADADDSKRAPAQQPGLVSVTCEVFEVWATHGKDAVDPAIGKQLGKRLANSLKQTELKLLSKSNVTLEKKKSQALKLAKGSATATLVEIVDKAQVRATVNFIAANKGKASQTGTTAAGDWVVTSVNQSADAKADAHVLAVGSCK